MPKDPKIERLLRVARMKAALRVRAELSARPAFSVPAAVGPETTVETADRLLSILPDTSTDQDW